MAGVTLKPITKFLLDDAGPDHNQYWPGRSAMGTAYDEVVVGQGDTCAQAYEDAIDQLVDLDYDIESLPKKPTDLDLQASLSEEQIDDGEWSWYVAIFVK